MRFSSAAERGLAEVGLVIAAMGCRPEVRVRGIVFADQQKTARPSQHHLGLDLDAEVGGGSGKSHGSGRETRGVTLFRPPGDRLMSGLQSVKQNLQFLQILTGAYALFAEYSHKC
jgi:hypothetical protein